MGNPKCPENFHCVEDPLIEGNGRCIEVEYEECGGVENLQCTDDHHVCIDDPTDDCTTGSCAGICVQKCHSWKKCNKPFECVDDPSCEPRLLSSFGSFAPKCSKVCLFPED